MACEGVRHRQRHRRRTRRRPNPRRRLTGRRRCSIYIVIIFMSLVNYIFPQNPTKTFQISDLLFFQYDTLQKYYYTKSKRGAGPWKKKKKKKMSLTSLMIVYILHRTSIYYSRSRSTIPVQSERCEDQEPKQRRQGHACHDLFFFSFSFFFFFLFGPQHPFHSG